jgi:hypothetical protein
MKDLVYKCYLLAWILLGKNYFSCSFGLYGQIVDFTGKIDFTGKPVSSGFAHLLAFAHKIRNLHIKSFKP